MHVFGVRQEWGGLCSEQCGRVSGDVAFQFALKFCGTKECMAFFFINSISLKESPIDPGPHLFMRIQRGIFRLHLENIP